MKLLPPLLSMCLTTDRKNNNEAKVMMLMKVWTRQLLLEVMTGSQTSPYFLGSGSKSKSSMQPFSLLVGYILLLGNVRNSHLPLKVSVLPVFRGQIINENSFVPIYLEFIFNYFDYYIQPSICNG